MTPADLALLSDHDRLVLMEAQMAKLWAHVSGLRQQVISQSGQLGCQASWLQRLDAKFNPPPISPEAQAIYEAYPLKVGKPAALKVIQKLISSGVDPAYLLARTKAFATARAGNKDYLPHPATWFRQARYQDDPSTWVPMVNLTHRAGIDTALRAELAGLNDSYRLAQTQAEKDSLLA